MEIRLNIETFTPKHLGALIGAMLTCGTLTREALAHVTEPHLTETPPEVAPMLTMGALLETSPITLTGVICQRGPQFTTAQITDMLQSLNAELYSRRTINPDDNPAAGVEKAALNSDAPGLGGGGDSFARSEVVVGAGVDLAAVFGAANADTPAPPPPPTPEVQLDKKGLPWDVRIHASSKTINADGTWRQKRGVAPELVTTVETQLRAVMAVPVPPTLGPGSAADRAQEAANMASHTLYTDADVDRPEVICDTNGQVVLSLCKTCGRGEAELSEPCVALEAAPAKVIPPPPPTVVTPPAPPVPPSGDPTTFPELVQFITAQKLAGKLAQPQLDAALLAIGVEGALPVLAARPNLIPALVAKLRVLAGG